MEVGEIRKHKPRNLAKDGRLIELARGREDVERYVANTNQITAHNLKPGEVGANHYHDFKVETIQAIDQIEVHYEDIASKKRGTTTLEPGEVIHIPIRIAHAVRNPSEDEKAAFLERSNLAFNPADPRYDCHPYKLID